MSTIPCPRMLTDVSGASDYVTLGAKGTSVRTENESLGTDRVAAFACDTGTAEAFVAEAEDTALRTGRTNQALSLIQSHPLSDLDPSKPADVQKCNDAGYALAKRLYPDAKAMVVTHADAKGSEEEQAQGHGGKLHNHILIINDSNGKALKRTHWRMITPVNDQLMRDMDLSVATPGWKREYGRDWSEVRESKTEFDRQLGDKIVDALSNERSVDEDAYRTVLGEAGISIDEKRRTIRASTDGTVPEHESIGWTYKMRDETGTKDRMRRRSASKLSKEFTHDEVMEVLDINRQIAEGITLDTTTHQEDPHHECQGHPEEAARIRTADEAGVDLTVADAIADADTVEPGGRGSNGASADPHGGLAGTDRELGEPHRQGGRDGARRNGRDDHCDEQAAAEAGPASPGAGDLGGDAKRERRTREVQRTVEQRRRRRQRQRDAEQAGGSEGVPGQHDRPVAGAEGRSGERGAGTAPGDREGSESALDKDKRDIQAGRSPVFRSGNTGREGRDVTD
ncbi:MAG: hypothetical protein ACI38U_02155 [Corynebacterium sp.]|uniref:hypothetical protein n=1 Tax=Corynebacterium sp. TaxID=1720 RepID=UPI003F129666